MRVRDQPQGYCRKANRPARALCQPSGLPGEHDVHTVGLNAPNRVSTPKPASAKLFWRLRALVHPLAGEAFGVAEAARPTAPRGVFDIAEMDAHFFGTSFRIPIALSSTSTRAEGIRT